MRGGVWSRAAAARGAMRRRERRGAEEDGRKRVREQSVASVVDECRRCSACIPSLRAFLQPQRAEGDATAAAALPQLALLRVAPCALRLFATHLTQFAHCTLLFSSADTQRREKMRAAAATAKGSSSRRRQSQPQQPQRAREVFSPCSFKNERN